MKKTGGNRDGDNIVKSMRSGCDSKTAEGEKNGKVNACDRPKNKLSQIERIDGIELPTEKINMMVCTEQGRGNEDWKHDGICMGQLKRILE